MIKLLVTVDIVLFTILDRRLHVLLIKRLAKPFVGRKSLWKLLPIENCKKKQALRKFIWNNSILLASPGAIPEVE